MRKCINIWEVIFRQSWNGTRMTRIERNETDKKKKDRVRFYNCTQRSNVNKCLHYS